MQELQERSGAAVPTSQKVHSEQSPSLGDISPALGLAKERYDAPCDDLLRRDLSIYINGRLAQSALGAARAGDRTHVVTHSNLLVKPLGLWGAVVRLVEFLPEHFHRVIFSSYSSIRRVARRLLSR